MRKKKRENRRMEQAVLQVFIAGTLKTGHQRAEKNGNPDGKLLKRKKEVRDFKRAEKSLRARDTPVHYGPKGESENREGCLGGRKEILGGMGDRPSPGASRTRGGVGEVKEETP